MIKRIAMIWIICSMMILNVGNSFASSEGVSGGGAHRDPNGTDVYIGVAVDYMAKVRFEVYDGRTKGKDPEVPIEGASIEIFVPSLGRYVLYGLTDSEGVLEVDVIDESKNPNFIPNPNLPSERILGSINLNDYNGKMLYLPNNKMSYKVYKANWIPYPKMEKAELQLEPIPMVLPSYLYELITEEKPARPIPPGSGGGGGGGGGRVLGGNETKTEPAETESVPETEETETPVSDPGNDIDTLPKTGVQGYMNMWMTGFLLFAIAISLIIFLMKKENEDKKDKQK